VRFCFLNGVTAPSGPGILIIEPSWSHWDTPNSVGLLWTSDQPDAETSTWQHMTLTRNIHPASSGIWNRNHSSERPRTHALDRAATGTGWGIFTRKYCSRFTPHIYHNRN
jgi:hypothetical protein